MNDVLLNNLVHFDINNAVNIVFVFRIHNESY